MGGLSEWLGDETLPVTFAKETLTKLLEDNSILASSSNIDITGQAIECAKLARTPPGPRDRKDPFIEEIRRFWALREMTREVRAAGLTTVKLDAIQATVERLLKQLQNLDEHNVDWGLAIASKRERGTLLNIREHLKTVGAPTWQSREPHPQPRPPRPQPRLPRQDQTAVCILYELLCHLEPPMRVATAHPAKKCRLITFLIDASKLIGIDSCQGDTSRSIATTIKNWREEQIEEAENDR